MLLCLMHLMKNKANFEETTDQRHEAKEHYDNSGILSDEGQSEIEHKDIRANEHKSLSVNESALVCTAHPTEFEKQSQF